MILQNNSSKIIGIGETSFLPGESAECPKSYENNPVVRKYIDDGVFTEIQNEKKKGGKKDTANSDDTAKSMDTDVTAKSDDAGKQAGTK